MNTEPAPAKPDRAAVPRPSFRQRQRLLMVFESGLRRVLREGHDVGLSAEEMRGRAEYVLARLERGQL